MKRAINSHKALLVFFAMFCISSKANISCAVAAGCPTIVVSPVQATVCAGKSVTLSASGAVNYTWTKSPGGPAPQYTPVIAVTPTSSTLYKVIGDDGQGCKDSAQVVVVVNPMPNVTTAANKTLVCVGAPSTLIAGPGGTLHSFQWSSNAGGAQTNTVVVTPTIATVYQVTVTNNSTGCSASRSIQVNVFDPIVSLVGTGTACVGSPLSFSINGLPATNYSIAPPPGPSLTALPGTTHYTLSGYQWSAGNYVSCYDSDTVSVTGLPTPVITVAASPTLLCEGESSTITAEGGITYTWNVPGSGNAITVTAANNSIYKVTGSGSNGCVSNATIALGVLPCTGVSEVSSLNNDIRIFPNPNNGDFTIQSESDVEIRIINIIGQEIKKLTLDEQNRHRVNLNHLPEGVYFVSGSSGDSIVIVR